MDSDDRFEQLKVKFRPALEFLEQRQIPIQAMNVQDDRLLVRGIAPSEAMRDQILEQFRHCDPSLDNVHADIRIDGADNVDSTGQSSVQNSGVQSQK